MEEYVLETALYLIENQQASEILQNIRTELTNAVRNAILRESVKYFV